MYVFFIKSAMQYRLFLKTQVFFVFLFVFDIDAKLSYIEEMSLRLIKQKTVNEKFVKGYRV